jgi:hypothetical protein
MKEKGKKKYIYPTLLEYKGIHISRQHLILVGRSRVK